MENGQEMLGNDAMNAIPTVTTQEELDALLGGSAAAPAKPGNDGKETPPAPAGKGNPPANTIGDPPKPDEDPPNEDEDEDEEEGGGVEEGKKLSDYPSMVHYLNETHELGLNLEDQVELKPEEQAELISEVIQRMTENVNASLSEYDYIDTLLQDPEVKLVLDAKREGKALRDLYTTFVDSPALVDDDTLAVQDFKKRFPKASDEGIRSMVDSLKKNSQFEPFIKGLREQHAEEQSSAEEARVKLQQEQIKADRQREQEELEEYSSYVTSLAHVHGIPVTNEMKANILKMTTRRDKDGNTALDLALQSNQGIVLAALGVAYIESIIKNAASLHGNRKNAKLMDKVFSTPEKLQGSSGGRQEKVDEEKELLLLNNF